MVTTGKKNIFLNTWITTEPEGLWIPPPTHTHTQILLFQCLVICFKLGHLITSAIKLRSSLAKSPCNNMHEWCLLFPTHKMKSSAATKTTCEEKSTLNSNQYRYPVPACDFWRTPKTSTYIMKKTVFWHVTLYTLVEICRPFGGAKCLRLQEMWGSRFHRKVGQNTTRLHGTSKGTAFLSPLTEPQIYTITDTYSNECAKSKLPSTCLERCE